MLILTITSTALAVLLWIAAGLVGPTFPNWPLFTLSVLFTIVALIGLLYFKVDKVHQGLAEAKQKETNQDRSNS